MNRSIRIAWSALGVLLVAMVGQVVLTAGQWPERVATHFNGAGQPDAWSSRQGHLIFWICFAVLMPLGMSTLFYSVRFMPAGLVNIPHREYWLAPERREDTAAKMQSMGVWFSCWMSVFFLGLYQLLLNANQVEPATLNAKQFFILLGIYLAGVAVWVVMLHRSFRLPRPSAASV